MKRNHLQLASQPRERLFAVACLMMAGVCCLGLFARAAPAELVPPDTPDIYSGFITVAYDAPTGDLTADGFAFSLKDATETHTISGGQFDLDAAIDNSGVLQSGTLLIGGTISALGFNSGTLLTGNLTSLTFDGPVTMGFLFDVTGGDAATLYGYGVQGTYGTLLLHSYAFLGNFQNSFNNYSGTSNGGVAPEPSAVITWGLLGAIGIPVWWWRRRKLRT